MGPEPYRRDLCRKALLARVLAEAEIEQGYARYDLDSTKLNEALDDARSLSLFASSRLIWISGAEIALPRKLTESSAGEGAAATVADYLRHAPPGVVVVFDCQRFEFEGDDKPKLDRVLKFYRAIPDVVEFRPFTVDAARRLAQERARELGLQLGVAELGLLVEALGGDGARVAAEIEKLSLYAGRDRKITANDIRDLVPNAPEATIFELVSALGRGDRARSLAALDTLLRDGEYLPLALTYLGTQFRLALAAQEANLRNASQIQAHFTRLGLRVWRERAEQIQQTVSAFSKERLATAVDSVYQTDRAFRDTRPDDRIVMERLVFLLTARA